MPDPASPLPENLRYLCADKPSVAKVCRDIGINHQQFSKYLSGRSVPSPNNLRRIATYFGVEEEMLGGPLEALKSHRAAQYPARRKVDDDPFAEAFPGDLAHLRRYLGAYQVFFLSPAAPGQIVVNAIFLDERSGMVYSRLIETIPKSSGLTRRYTRCDGKAALHADRLFVVDFEAMNQGAFSMTSLVLPHRQNKDYLFGKMSFLASLPRRSPYASNVVWKRMKAYHSPRDLLRTCGFYPADSRLIPPVVRRFLETGQDDARAEDF